MAKLYKVKITSDRDGVNWAEDPTGLPGFGACPTSSCDEKWAGTWPRTQAELIAQTHRKGKTVVELIPV